MTIKFFNSHIDRRSEPESLTSAEYRHLTATYAWSRDGLRHLGALTTDNFGLFGDSLSQSFPRLDSLQAARHVDVHPHAVQARPQESC